MTVHHGQARSVPGGLDCLVRKSMKLIVLTSLTKSRDHLHRDRNKHGAKSAVHS